MSDKLQSAETVDDVIRAIGSPADLAALTGRTVQAVSNWKADNKLPSWSYLVLSQHLESIGWQASPSLWGIVEPESVSP